ncbi:hypothetical protein VTJ04DRAFT_2993 [Mycothermus thermophilus]|uniref:uncharacterized protein n=1 Tax=Humicola insolens TaxID=85995 RepID=UPI003743162A
MMRRSGWMDCSQKYLFNDHKPHRRHNATPPSSCTYLSCPPAVHHLISLHDPVHSSSSIRRPFLIVIIITINMIMIIMISLHILLLPPPFPNTCLPRPAVQIDERKGKSRKQRRRNMNIQQKRKEIKKISGMYWWGEKD